MMCALKLDDKAQSLQLVHTRMCKDSLRVKLRTSDKKKMSMKCKCLLIYRWNIKLMYTSTFIDFSGASVSIYCHNVYNKKKENTINNSHKICAELWIRRLDFLTRHFIWLFISIGWISYGLNIFCHSQFVSFGCCRRSIFCCCALVWQIINNGITFSTGMRVVAPNFIFIFGQF